MLAEIVLQQLQVTSPIHPIPPRSCYEHNKSHSKPLQQSLAVVSGCCSMLSLCLYLECTLLLLLEDCCELLSWPSLILVHGLLCVRPCISEGKKPFSLGAYCLGKIVWGKGWEELIALLSQHSEARSQVLSVPLDIYGTGEAASEVRSALGPCMQRQCLSTLIHLWQPAAHISTGHTAGMKSNPQH